MPPVPEPEETHEPPADTSSDAPVSPDATASPEVAVSGEQKEAPMPPTAPPAPPAPPARVVEGTVTSVSEAEVELTLDDGRAGVIVRRDFSLDNTDPRSVLSVDDKAFGVELAREDPKSRVVLSRSWALKLRAWETVKQIHADSGTVTAHVTSVGAKGLVATVHGLRGFIPSSHLELAPPVDLPSYADQAIEVKILELDPGRERLVLSRRSILMKAQRQAASELLQALKPGERREGTVTSITDYGAFVDIGAGVNGLVHLSELSWDRVRHASDVLSLGQQIEVEVIDVRPRKRRVGLSIRRLTVDPLAEIVVDSVVEGTVTRLADFGAFVSLGTVEGLVHISELAEYRVEVPQEVVAPGDRIFVKVLSVDRKRRRIELSVRRAAEFSG